MLFRLFLLKLCSTKEWDDEDTQREIEVFSNDGREEV